MLLFVPRFDTANHRYAGGSLRKMVIWAKSNFACPYNGWSGGGVPVTVFSSLPPRFGFPRVRWELVEKDCWRAPEMQDFARYVEMDPDVRLMLAVQLDDTRAFNELVSRYEQRLISVLALLMGDRELARDLSQEVFLRVFRARKTYQPTAKFCTWLFTIANNVACNARRARRFPYQLNSGDSGTFVVEPLAKKGAAMPSHALDRAEEVALVRKAIAGLSERQRSALVLCKFQGMSYAEIARTMATTPKAVKALLARARDNLRVSLAPYVRDGSPLPSAK